MGYGSKPNVTVIACLVGMIALAGFQFYTVSNIRALESTVAEVRAEQNKAKATISAEIEQVRGAASQAVSDREKTIADVRTQAEQTARDTARGAVGRVKEETLKSVQELNNRIAANEQHLKESQTQVATELSGVKQSTEATQSTLAAVTNDVRGVRDELATTRGQLNATIADLKRVNGDLGVMSGLIATNGKEIDALRQLGDRNYTEFTVWKSKDAIRVGEVWIQLKSVDPGKNRFTIELRADDRKIEKKDRTVNEPVQFFVGRNRQPHELVVNQVQKNQIIGYLATPKAAAR
jgi:chromosome segregation ATPase